jgi:hypothetical protein
MHLMNANELHSDVHNMPKTAALSIRISPEVKAAIERAAEADSRPVASMAEKILAEWLRANGYLKSAKK